MTPMVVVLLLLLLLQVLSDGVLDATTLRLAKILDTVSSSVGGLLRRSAWCKYLPCNAAPMQHTSDVSYLVLFMVILVMLLENMVLTFGREHKPPAKQTDIESDSMERPASVMHARNACRKELNASIERSSKRARDIFTA